MQVKVKLAKRVRYGQGVHTVGDIIDVAKDDVKEIEDRQLGEQVIVEEVDYTKMTRKELEKVLTEKGIEFNTSNSKGDLLDLVLGSD